jgi:hypothetical protein
MKFLRFALLSSSSLLLAAATAAGCTDEPSAPHLGAARSPGMLNGMLNGFFYTEGLTELLGQQCPLLAERLLVTGHLDEPFPQALEGELAKQVCDHFLFYTVELMLPIDQELTLSIGEQPIASYAGKMDLQYLVRKAYPQYEFATGAFAPSYPIARKVVTQGYAALTNEISRTVSFKTNVPQLDAHRGLGEDAWPREFTQLVPFTTAGIAAMTIDPDFVGRLPDFFNGCDPHQTTYDYLQKPKVCPGPSVSAIARANLIADRCIGDSLNLPESGPPAPRCPLPVVVHGNLGYVQDVVPGRSCRIVHAGEEVPAGSFLVGDVIVPEGGCPFIYYTGRTPGQTIYDDRAHNPIGVPDGCLVEGPSSLTNCVFKVIANGQPIPSEYIAHYVFNVKPIAP